MNEANTYFEHNETINKLYFTSDGLAFFEEQQAVEHASGLPNGTITARTREEVDEALSALPFDHWNDDTGTGSGDINDIE